MNSKNNSDLKNIVKSPIDDFYKKIQIGFKEEFDNYINRELKDNKACILKIKEIDKHIEETAYNGKLELKKNKYF